MSKILLVENDALIGLVLKEDLTDCGYDVEAFFNADAASKHFLGGTRYDALLTDVNLPGRMNMASSSRIGR